GLISLCGLLSLPTRRSSDLRRAKRTACHCDVQALFQIFLGAGLWLVLPFGCSHSSPMAFSSVVSVNHPLDLIPLESYVSSQKATDRKSTRLNSSHVSISYAV